MEDLGSHTTPLTEPTTREPSLVRTSTLAISTALALAAGFGAGWFSHTGSTGSGSPAATTAVHGSLTLPDGGYTSVGSVCSGSGGYQDISAGVAVTIGDQAGKTLAVTSLGAGGFGGGGCVFPFSASVPAAASYTVTISHRGTQVFPAADVASGFNLTLNAG